MKCSLSCRSQLPCLLLWKLLAAPKAGHSPVLPGHLELSLHPPCVGPCLPCPPGRLLQEGALCLCVASEHVLHDGTKRKPTVVNPGSLTTGPVVLLTDETVVRDYHRGKTTEQAAEVCLSHINTTIPVVRSIRPCIIQIPSYEVMKE